MIHAYKDDMETIPRISGEALDGMIGHVKEVDDGGQHFIMLLVAYPSSGTKKVIQNLKYGR